MNKHPHDPSDNVTPMLAKQPEGVSPPRDFSGTSGDPEALAGSPDDPRMKEALRLIEAFLAIEDPAARAALVTLAKSLVSYDWLRKVQQR